MTREFTVPIHGPYGNIEQWLTSAGAPELLAEARYSPVFSEQSFEPGEQELRDLWPDGAWMSWFGGPAVSPLPEWPRRPDGTALAHVAAIHLGDLNSVVDAEGKAAWPAGSLREGLPTSGVLEVFHDGETFGYEPGDSGAWLVRWADSTRGELIDPPPGVDPLPCQVVMPMPGFTLPAAADAVCGSHDRFALAESLELEYQQCWRYQRTLSWGEPIPVSHAYGHSHRGHINAVKQILPGVLPLDGADEYRLILDLKSRTALAGRFGDAGNLEVWMRESDLAARRFDHAWCLIRTD